MGNVRIDLNSAGIQELIQSAEIGKVCEAAAAKMTQATGIKYVPLVRVSGDRIAARAYERKSNDRDNNP